MDESGARWVLIEIVGGQRGCGTMTTETIAGTDFIRLETLDGTVHLWPPSSVFAIEEVDDQRVRDFHDLLHGAHPDQMSEEHPDYYEEIG